MRRRQLRGFRERGILAVRVGVVAGKAQAAFAVALERDPKKGKSIRRKVHAHSTPPIWTLRPQFL
jgi:hypothetical protein